LWSDENIMSNNMYAYGATDRVSDTSKVNPTPLQGITRAQIEHLVQNPQRVEKRQGAYVIPSTLLTRNFKQQRESGQYGFGWLDIDETAVTKQQLIDIIVAIMPGHAFYIYSTASASPDRPKYRVIWFYSSLINTGAQWSRYQEHINNAIEASGIKPDRVNERSAQLCFLPNAPGDFYDFHIQPGADADPVAWDAAGILPALVIATPINREMLAEENPNFDKLLDHVTILDEDNPTGILIECPWHDEHSGGGNSALLVPPGADNANRGGFRCLHHSHENHNIGHAYNWAGLDPEKACPTEMFGTEAPVVPAGAVATIAPQIDTAFKATETLAQCATASLEDMGAIVRSIAALDLVEQEACIIRYSQSSGASVAAIRKTLKAVDTQLRTERKQQVMSQRATMGHELSSLNLTSNGEIHNVNGFARIDADSQIIAALAIDHLGNPRVTTRTYGMFADWGKSQPKYFDDAEDKYKIISDAWLEAGPVVHDVFDALTFLPGQPRIVETTTGTHRRQLNTYTPPSQSMRAPPLRGLMSVNWTVTCAKSLLGK